MEKETKYYAVECKCGHADSIKYYIPITFAIKAINGKEAARIGREIPRCKHHHKDCVLNVKEINYEEYLMLLSINNEDPYLQCKNIQEQRRIDLSSRMKLEPKYDDFDYYEEEERKHPVFYGKEIVKNPKKYFRLNVNYRMEECC